LKRIRELIWIAIGLVVFTLLVWGLDLDLTIAARCYVPGQGWPGLTNGFWQLIYTITPVPALLLGGIALVVLVLGFRFDRLRRGRRQSLFLLLFLALGPGLLVNVLLKDHLTKPRPSELVEFGGQYHHSQFWQQNGSEPRRNNSFPSGHASIAFAVIGPWFFLRQRHSRMAVSFLAGGIGWGAVVGMARMLQGGHFFSDVVWAGGLVYLVGGMLALCFSFERPSLTAPLA
jgi:membrane-associated PAP2 superfamily phosphatase